MNPTFQFNSSEPCVGVEFFDQLFNRIFKATKQASLIFVSKDFRGESWSQFIKPHNPFYTIVEAFLKLLLKDWKSRRVLNLLLSKFADDYWVLFDTGDDVRLIKGSLLHEDRWGICKIATQTQTIHNNGKKLDYMQVSTKTSKQLLKIKLKSIH